MGADPPEDWCQRPAVHVLLLNSRREGSAESQQGRAGWRARLQAHAYHNASAEHAPLVFPRFSVDGPSESLEELRLAVRAARASFTQRQALHRKGGGGTGAPQGPRLDDMGARSNGKKRKRNRKAHSPAASHN